MYLPVSFLYLGVHFNAGSGKNFEHVREELQEGQSKATYSHRANEKYGNAQKEPLQARGVVLVERLGRSGV